MLELAVSEGLAQVHWSLQLIHNHVLLLMSTFHHENKKKTFTLQRIVSKEANRGRVTPSTEFTCYHVAYLIGLSHLCALLVYQCLIVPTNENVQMKQASAATFQNMEHFSYNAANVRLVLNENKYEPDGQKICRHQLTVLWCVQFICFTK